MHDDDNVIFCGVDNGDVRVDENELGDDALDDDDERDDDERDDDEALWVAFFLSFKCDVVFEM